MPKQTPLLERLYFPAALYDSRNPMGKSTESSRADWAKRTKLPEEPWAFLFKATGFGGLRDKLHSSNGEEKIHARRSLGALLNGNPNEYLGPAGDVTLTDDMDIHEMLWNQGFPELVADYGGKIRKRAVDLLADEASSKGLKGNRNALIQYTVQSLAPICKADPLVQEILQAEQALQKGTVDPKQLEASLQLTHGEHAGLKVMSYQNLPAPYQRDVYAGYLQVNLRSARQRFGEQFIKGKLGKEELNKKEISRLLSDVEKVDAEGLYTGLTAYITAATAPKKP